ncbi:Protein of unknown function (DUF3067) [Synechococcus sp. PCC 7502]|uniref:DUF3067 family protein n=1 Tax=Synechococcus sp. PCC 7502 TaxID=1173263 RepID=UPI00029FA367|nr:DUF3067 family protein [Synechococcus sp. PCC 7502]AFY72608.1 Protein of unknown function (DUF3067) [Synechococcus sp. PCC 7502]
MNGRDLQQLIQTKWGHSYDLQLRRSQGRIWLQVMWRYLEQQSFPLSEAEYLEHLDSLATHLHEWGAIEQVKNFIATTKLRPRLGKAVGIPLELQLGLRSLEWMLEES